MATHISLKEINEVYFCTLSCYRWLPLFEWADAYEAVYKWFDHLRGDHCFVLGYVVMPNHIHVLLFHTHSSKKINHLIGEGKRFMAYRIVSNLKKSGNTKLLRVLANGVRSSERAKKKRHQVFRLSFDAKKCFTKHMMEKKLDYIHHNPVSGKWRLVKDYTDYLHSSARFYETGEDSAYPVVHYKDLGNQPAASESSASDSEGGRVWGMRNEELRMKKIYRSITKDGLRITN